MSDRLPNSKLPIYRELIDRENFYQNYPAVVRRGILTPKILTTSIC